MISGTLYDMRPNQTVENIAIVAAIDVMLIDSVFGQV